MSDTPVFPNPMHDGMRDYFAANAMASIIAKFPAIKDKKDGEKFMAACAEGAYGFADAMLKARELK